VCCWSVKEKWVLVPDVKMSASLVMQDKDPSLKSHDNATRDSNACFGVKVES